MIRPETMFQSALNIQEPAQTAGIFQLTPETASQAPFVRRTTTVVPVQPVATVPVSVPVVDGVFVFYFMCVSKCLLANIFVFSTI